MSNNLSRTEVGATQNQKTVTINDSDGILDASLTETLDIDFTSADKVLTATEFTQNFEFNSTNLTVARNLTVPQSKRFFFVNNENGTNTLSVIRGTTTIVIAIAENGLFYTDGTANGLIQTAGGAGGGGGGGFEELDWKQSVRAATTANGTLATAYENGDALDGVTLATGDRILLKDQTAGAENGIYTVNVSGAPTRATDYDADAEVTSGAACYVEEGTVNSSIVYFLATTGTIIVGTTALVYTADPIGGLASATVQTTDATVTTLMTISVPSGESTAINVFGSAIEPANENSMAFRVLGSASNTAGTTRLNGFIVEMARDEADTPGVADWDVTVDIDDTTDVIRVRVTGEAATTIDWAASATSLTNPTVLSAQAVQVGGFVGGVPTVSTIVLRYLAPVAVDFVADLVGSVGHAGTAPSAQTDFDVQVNGVSEGTMRFAASGTVATFLTNPTFSLVSGDRLDLVTPANLNGLADFSFTLSGTKG